MKFIQKAVAGFSKFELALWGGSAGAVLLAFVLFDRTDWLTLTASLIGVTSLIYSARGHAFGQLLMVIFSMIYGVISWRVAYYGEMITYLGMTMPMALAALISWLRHPYAGNHAQVAVNRLSRRELPLLAGLTAAVTVAFYFILAAFDTANLAVSTLSVATSFAAVYLTFRRSPFFALAYAANDVVLLVLWTMAALQDTGCLSVVACFAAFLVNDLYGFFNWLRMLRRQHGFES